MEVTGEIRRPGGDGSAEKIGFESMEKRQKVIHGARRRYGLEVSTLIRIELLKRSWTSRSLALKCGLAGSTIRDQFARGFPSKRSRLLVEDAIGRPIFSGGPTWKRRKALKEALGFDPELASKDQLQAWATRRGIPYSIRGQPFKKAELINILAHHLL